MPLPAPEPGLVIRYGFLWGREAEAQRQRGAKARPCAIVTSVSRADDEVIVTVAPITHSPPRDDAALELPPAVKRMLGLDEARSWIVTDELNVFRWPGPDLERIDAEAFAYGRLPRPMLVALIRAVLAQVRQGRARPVRRTE